MSKKTFGRWVAGVAVVAGLALGVLSSSHRTMNTAESGEIVWGSSSSVSVLR